MQHLALGALLDRPLSTQSCAVNIGMCQKHYLPSFVSHRLGSMAKTMTWLVISCNPKKLDCVAYHSNQLIEAQFCCCKPCKLDHRECTDRHKDHCNLHKLMNCFMLFEYWFTGLYEKKLSRQEAPNSVLEGVYVLLNKILTHNLWARRPAQHLIATLVQDPLLDLLVRHL